MQRCGLPLQHSDATITNVEVTASLPPRISALGLATPVKAWQVCTFLEATPRGINDTFVSCVYACTMRAFPFKRIGVPNVGAMVQVYEKQLSWSVLIVITVRLSTPVTSAIFVGNSPLVVDGVGLLGAR